MLLKKLLHHFTAELNLRKGFAVTMGVIVSGLGIAILKFSCMGNDPFSAMNMAMSDGLHVGLGNYQLVLNLVLIVVQLIFGRKFIGFGTIMNMCFLGYIVQFFGMILSFLFGSMEGSALPLQLLVMVLALAVLAFGLSMYQTANLGVAPYDYLSMGLTEFTKRPYFIFRVLTDLGCITVIVIAHFCGLFPWSGSHIGIGTVACAVGLGPMINLFMKMNRKWILHEK